MLRSHLKISVPEPCTENWAAIDTHQKGKFCRSCSTVITDFSNFTDNELLAFFSKPNLKVCGHFSREQLNHPIYLENKKPQKSWSNIAAVIALWFGLSTQTQAQKQIAFGKPKIQNFQEIKSSENKKVKLKVREKTK